MLLLAFGALLILVLQSVLRPYRADDCEGLNCNTEGRKNKSRGVTIDKQLIELDVCVDTYQDLLATEGSLV